MRANVDFEKKIGMNVKVFYGISKQDDTKYARECRF